MAHITVCITTYNRWPKCALAVESVLAQVSVRVDIVLVDDHSDEKIPAETYHKLSTAGGVYIRHDTNRGLAAARNTAIEAAQGDWFAFCDDDDQWPPDFAASLLHAVEQALGRADAAIALSSSKRTACDEFLSPLPSIQDLMLAGVTPPVAAQMYRTSILRDVGGYDPRVRSGVDHDLWITLAAGVDPRAAVVWGAGPIVGNRPDGQRMTTNEKLRKEGIQNALQIWKPKLVSTFGHGFYVHFRKSYERYLKRKFLILDIRKRRFLSAAIRAFSPAEFFWIMRRTVLRFQPERRCGLFAPYTRTAGTSSRD